jgi:flagellar biosynthesis protein FlhG
MMAARAESRNVGFQSIAITSGKGGVGKTNIAVNLGLALAEAGVRIALMDADWGLSNTEVLLGVVPSHDLRDVLRGDCRMEEIIHDGPLGLKLIPGASGVAELANLPNQDRTRLLQELSRVGDIADAVLLDTSPGISDPVIDLVVSADQILVVTTPEPTSLTDAYASAKVILQRRKGAPVGLVVNMVSSKNHAQEIASAFAKVTERFLGYAVPLRGFVCMDPKVQDSVRRQSPLLLSYPRSVAANCIRDLAMDILSNPGMRDACIPGLLGESA